MNKREKKLSMRSSKFAILLELQQVRKQLRKEQEHSVGCLKEANIECGKRKNLEDALRQIKELSATAERTNMIPDFMILGVKIRELCSKNNI